MTRALMNKRFAFSTLPAVALLVFGSIPVWAHEGALGNKVMWQVCENRKLNEQCAFQNADHDTYRGSCQSMASHLVCVRNQPIQYASSGGHTHPPSEALQQNADEGGYSLVFGAFAIVAGLAFALGSARNRKRDVDAPAASN